MQMNELNSLLDYDHIRKRQDFSVSAFLTFDDVQVPIVITACDNIISSQEELNHIKDDGLTHIETTACLSHSATTYGFFAKRNDLRGGRRLARGKNLDTVSEFM